MQLQSIIKQILKGSDDGISGSWTLYIILCSARVCVSPLNLRTDKHPVSKTLCSLEYWTMEKVQTPVIPESFIK
jgi:hypothetical protein